jgi:hypothetical protein
MMKDQPRPATNATDWATDRKMDQTTDQNFEELLSTHLGLFGLEPFYIDWELIWPM